jgi:hypothetical protein
MKNENNFRDGNRLDDKNLKSQDSTIKKVSEKVGDSIEHAGRKMQDKGFTKSGQAVENFGDKIEHLKD